MKNDERTQLCDQLLSGAASKPAEPVDHQYFENLRRQVQLAKPAVRPTPTD